LATAFAPEAATLPTSAAAFEAELPTESSALPVASAAFEVDALASVAAPWWR
jgi:hypothetical protein